MYVIFTTNQLDAQATLPVGGLDNAPSAMEAPKFCDPLRPGGNCPARLWDSRCVGHSTQLSLVTKSMGGFYSRSWHIPRARQRSGGYYAILDPWHHGFQLWWPRHELGNEFRAFLILRWVVSRFLRCI
jgi:hypothetical protein